ncbi:hypothetical protein ACHAXT_013230 [Thalassiosira profunda]
MEPDDPPRTASSKKKKSKKDKKRKSRDGSSPSSELINGTNNNGSRDSSGKKRKKEKKRRKKESIGDDDERGQSRAVKSEEPSHDEEPSIPSALEIQELASRKRPHDAPASGPGSALSFTAASPASASANTKRSPYQLKTIVGSAALLPSSLSDVQARITSLLHSLLLTYDANMGGVLLSLEGEVELLPVDRTANTNSGIHNRDTVGGGLIGGRIMDDLPHIHHRFRAKGLLFCPKLGMRLRGQVVECTPTFITLTTHHILSTKIGTEKLREVGFVYDANTQEWIREREVRGEGDEEGGAGESGVLLGPSTSIYLDDSVEFVVERIHECGGYISLEGARPSVSTLG